MPCFSRRPIFMLLAPTLVILPVMFSSLHAKTKTETILENMDKNDDGKVAKKEWRGPKPAFSKIDTDGDGFLSTEELDSRFGTAQAAGAQAAAEQAPDKAPVPWVDVHVHPNSGSYSVKSIIKTMQDDPWAKAVLMPTPQNDNPWKLEDYYKAAKKYPGRLVYLGGGGTLNPMIHADSPDGVVSEKLKKRFIKRAEDIIKKGAVGFGEIAILHPSLERGHPFESVEGDHPLLLALADIAAKHNLVIDIHNDPVVEDIKTPDWLNPKSNPPMLKRNIDSFERLLAHNREAKIIWAHAGSDIIGHWTPGLTRELLEKHPNLYMSLRMTKGRMQNPPAGNFPMGPAGIKPGWLNIFNDFSDRFVIGNDQFFVRSGGNGPGATFSKAAVKMRATTNRFLSLLPDDLARKIGYENATRLYKLKP